MSNSFFRFKQFTVYQDQCAMKVGTDGVLLGAWTNVSRSGVILDVGTGTGLISLMIAQRNPSAGIVAIDIDRNAVAQAGQNIANSPFSDRMSVELSDFRIYASQRPATFDLIVSNPPYFANSLLSPDRARTWARHSVSLTLDELFHSSAGCLTPEGVLALILPFDKQDELAQLSVEYGFFLKRQTVVYPLPDALPKRLLTEWTMYRIDYPVHSALIIEYARHQYSREYLDLVRDFYLNKNPG